MFKTSFKTTPARLPNVHVELDLGCLLLDFLLVSSSGLDLLYVSFLAGYAVSLVDEISLAAFLLHVLACSQFCGAQQTSLSLTVLALARI